MGSWMYSPYDLTLRQSSSHPGGVTGWNAIQSHYHDQVIEVIETTSGMFTWQMRPKLYVASFAKGAARCSSHGHQTATLQWSIEVHTYGYFPPPHTTSGYGG